MARQNDLLCLCRICTTRLGRRCNCCLCKNCLVRYSELEADTLQNNKDINGFRIRVDRKQSRTFETPRRGPQPRAPGRYSHATFPRRRMGPVMEPPSPLRGLFDPPVGNEPHDMSAFTEDFAQSKLEASPPANDASAETYKSKKAFTPTPKKSPDDGANNRAYMGMETPSILHHPPPPVPMPWHHAFGPYGPPQMPPFGPMTPHATPGMMYGGYYPSPYYPSMFPDIFQMVSPTHAPPGQVPSQPQPPSQVAAMAPETSNGHGKTDERLE